MMRNKVRTKQSKTQEMVPNPAEQRQPQALDQRGLARKRPGITSPAGWFVAQGCRWFSSWQRARDQRRVHRAIARTAKHFAELYPEWAALLFDRHFLLHRGRPIIERHLAAPTATDAFDLALAWAEQWPALRSALRKRHLQGLTPVAAEFLRLLVLDLINPHADMAARQPNDRRRTGIPLTYVQSERQG